MQGQHTLMLVLQWQPFKGMYFTENTQFGNNGCLGNQRVTYIKGIGGIWEFVLEFISYSIF
jgi:hypothetical protein